jgi:hypothetical protein
MFVWCPTLTASSFRWSSSSSSPTSSPPRSSSVPPTLFFLSASPLVSIIVRILDLSPSPLIPYSTTTIASCYLNLSTSPLVDQEATTFVSPRGDRCITMGFIICLSNHSNPGLGRMMLLVVTDRAIDLRMGQVEWCVLDWSRNAINKGNRKKRRANSSTVARK